MCSRGGARPWRRRWTPNLRPLATSTSMRWPWPVAGKIPSLPMRRPWSRARSIGRRWSNTPSVSPPRPSTQRASSDGQAPSLLRRHRRYHRQRCERARPLRAPWKPQLPLRERAGHYPWWRQWPQPEALGSHGWLNLRRRPQRLPRSGPPLLRPRRSRRRRPPWSRCRSRPLPPCHRRARHPARRAQKRRGRPRSHDDLPPCDRRHHRPKT